MSEQIILRQWTGKVRREQQDAYLEYVLGTGGRDYASIPGNLGFQLLVRDQGDGVVEVTTLSWWASLDAVKAFAGEAYEMARYYPQDEQYLVDKPDQVVHHVVFAGASTKSNSSRGMRRGQDVQACRTRSLRRSGRCLSQDAAAMGRSVLVIVQSPLVHFAPSRKSAVDTHLSCRPTSPAENRRRSRFA